MDESNAADPDLKIIGLLGHCDEGKKVCRRKTEVVISAFEKTLKEKKMDTTNLRKCIMISVLLTVKCIFHNK